MIGIALLNMGVASAASPAAASSFINITKSVSPENLSKSASAVILLKISKQGSAPIKEVTITDLIPPVLTGEPQEVFKNNIFQKRLTLLDNTEYFSYSVSMKNDLKLSKDWTFSLPNAQATYKVSNDTQIRSAVSNSPSIKLLSEVNADWKIEHWPLYVTILFLIAIGSGAVGGAINYVLKYRSRMGGIVSKIEVRTDSYVLEVEYINYIEVGDTCDIKVTTYWFIPPPAATPEIRCYIIVKGEIVSYFSINIGQDEQHKEVTEESYVINDKKAVLKIKEGVLKDLKDIKINVTKRSLGRDVAAGAAAGIITLLALVTATSAVSGDQTWVSLDRYPQNVQSIVTLFVTCFIAGLVPFQILDKATGQLVDTIKITKEQVQNEENRANNAERNRKKMALVASEQTDRINQLLSTRTDLALPDFVDEASNRAQLLKEFLRAFI